ncbi:uncharacterized protein LOC123312059 [Coccinella septempunctata]|uniref:uncharacterized protein LOC123312059 n=1 Tax=Coccinella septempunctata TaxID=41139 RepID=UPI001D088295|nr:uncharacterized protein LOC123312059 [Coccinella septempunctata]
MKGALIILSIFTAVIAQNSTNSVAPVKKTYVCPKHFVRVGRRCYFFSKNSATWQQAIHKCQDKQSSIAIIKTANQDRRIRKILSRPTHAIHERWIGGMYNWKKMKWLWATTGKPLIYQGFHSQNFTESQKWHCIIMDPAVKYEWNTRPCLESKPYICHTKSKVIRRIEDPDKHSNDILLINNEIRDVPANLKEYSGDLGLANQNDAPIIPSRPKRRRKNKKKKINNTTILLHRPKYAGPNSTSSTDEKSSPMETIKYEIYNEDAKMTNSLYPNPIVEEYSFIQKN